MKISNFKGHIFVFLSALLFGSYGLWAVLLGNNFGVFFQGYVRAFLVLLILVPIAIYTRNWQKISVEDWKKYAWCILFGIFTQAPLYYAFQNAGVGISSLIFFASFLITSYVIGGVLLKEKFTTIKIISLVVAIIGLAFTFFKSIEVFSLFALLLAAINGIASGGEVSTTKLVPEKFGALQTSILVWAGIFITHLPLSLLFGEQQIIPTFDIQWLAMLGFTLAGVIAFLLVIEGFKYVDASIGGLIGLLEIVFAIIFGALFFKEEITLSVIVGSLLIFVAVVISSIAYNSRHNQIV